MDTPWRVGTVGIVAAVWGASAALAAGFVAVGIARRIEQVITGDRLPEPRR